MTAVRDGRREGAADPGQRQRTSPELQQDRPVHPSSSPKYSVPGSGSSSPSSSGLSSRSSSGSSSVSSSGSLSGWGSSWGSSTTPGGCGLASPPPPGPVAAM